VYQIAKLEAYKGDEINGKGEYRANLKEI